MPSAGVLFAPFRRLTARYAAGQESWVSTVTSATDVRPKAKSNSSVGSPVTTTWDGP